MSQMQHILVLDERSESFDSRYSFSDFVGVSDSVRLLVITNTGQLTEQDKQKCLACAEIDKPTSNGMLEIIAQQFHKEHRIDRIYTNQEELVLRAAALRELLGVKCGLYPREALLFRDKSEMKQVCHSKGVPCPRFKRIFSPSDIIAFADTNGYPIVVKPTLSCASVGVRIIRDFQDLSNYLKTEFFVGINDKDLDRPGTLIVEQFVPHQMCHVNGYARNGRIIHVWPFQYKNTNLNFTAGAEYGNISIPSTDPRHAALVNATQKVLDSLTCPDHVFFHCELFAAPEGYLLCEIAARKPGTPFNPGATICLLIDMLEGGNDTFPETEFRLSNGLDPRVKIHCRIEQPETTTECVGDILIRRPIGKLLKLPNPAECPVKNLKCIALAKENSTYYGYDVNIINTSMRMIAISERGVDPVVESLSQGIDWYKKNVEFAA